MGSNMAISNMGARYIFAIVVLLVNWTVKPGQDPLNLARIEYIHIKMYFRAMYLHK